jgi:hypothetical protein
VDDVAFNDWLVEALEESGVSRTTFTDRIAKISDVKKQTAMGKVSEWMRGHRVPEFDSCQHIARALGLDSREVLIAAGRMKDGDHLLTPILPPTKGLDDLAESHLTGPEVREGRRLIDALSDLTDAQLEMAVSILQAILPGGDDDAED